MSKLKEEFEFYLQNQQNFAKQYEGRVLVIKDKRIIGIFGNEAEALLETNKEHELGTFLIQPCSADPDSVVQTFHSRVEAYE